MHMTRPVVLDIKSSSFVFLHNFANSQISLSLQNRSERHLTVFCIDPNDLTLLFIMTIYEASQNIVSVFSAVKHL